MRIVLLQPVYQLLNILPLCVSVHGAWVFAYRKLVFVPESYDICLRDKNHGTDDGQIHAVQIGKG